MRRSARSPIAVAAALLLLAGCASAPEVEVRVAVAPEPAPPPPTLPAEIAASLAVPPLGADGQYRTINYGVGADEALWNMRSALNVAALGCRGAEDAVLTANYNALLRTQRSALAAALKAVDARFKAEQGPKWRDAEDAHMTRVYNFFAAPPAQQRFCAVAAAVSEEVKAVPAGGLPAYAASALQRLEAPFIDIFRTVDTYRRELAEWQARYAPAAAQTAQAGPTAPAVERPDPPTAIAFNRR